ncbi:hypothetical protein KSE_66340 [Kitasatospora setae KM-6054]|uniref:Gram-positive cocci surface proteins LPxTG domain-containing protein n=1 Tax=Kitasatospora setae (strain ATCC 33774 / DSM 43861 / JCM 3304 / KCC A-0304 / NBRC 14216 / KM-6054) TaxID=452652 RepID=E4N2K9_KITSK|nr:hypothetical protein KSE_66340 [Kitasatospora setae KM-6054]
MAAVAAPTVLGAGTAMAETGADPVGQSQPDAAPAEAAPAPAPAEAAPAEAAPAEAAPAPAAPAPAAEPAARAADSPSSAASGSGSSSPDPSPSPDPTPTPDPTPSGGTETPDPELEALRARLTAALEEQGHTPEYYAAGEAVKDGTKEQIKNVLDVELPRIVAAEAAQKELDQARAKVRKIIDESGLPAVRTAGQKALDGDLAALNHFIDVEYPAILEDTERAAIQQLLATPGIGPNVKSAATAALAGGLAEMRDFRAKFRDYLLADLQAQIEQAIAQGGPEVRKAAQIAKDSGDPDTMYAFLTSGLQAARARDEAAGQGKDDGLGDPSIPQLPSTGSTGAGSLTDVSLDTTGSTGTTTTTTADGNTTADATDLAATGTDAPIGSLLVGGATAIALGAGTLVLTRRRRQES